MTRYAMAIDLEHCTGCGTCVISCQLQNALRPGIAWNKIEALEWGVWPDIGRAYLPHACFHCDEPLCVRVCPTGASRKREDGIVTIDDEVCIGCGVCVTACQYGARSINISRTWHFGATEPAPYEAEGARRIGVAEKCSFCASRIDQGDVPACVDSCPIQIRFFGDLDDPNSTISSYLRETGARNAPGTAVYYATGASNIDLEQAVTQAFTSVKAMAALREPAPPETNPVVLGVSAVATAGVAVGLGLAVKRNVDRRIAANNPDELAAPSAADSPNGSAADSRESE